MEKRTTYKIRSKLSDQDESDHEVSETSREARRTEDSVRQTSHLIPENQLRSLIRSFIAEIQSIPKQQWYDTDPAYFLLGLDSAEKLRIMVRTKMLRLGTEVRDIRLQSSNKPHYQFHLDRCEARLLEPPEKRLRSYRSRSCA